VIEARGLSSAGSAANSAIAHVGLGAGSAPGDWVTMSVPSDGSYGIPKVSSTVFRLSAVTGNTKS